MSGENGVSGDGATLRLVAGALTDAPALALEHEPVPADQVVAGSPSTGYLALDSSDAGEIGVERAEASQRLGLEADVHQTDERAEGEVEIGALHPRLAQLRHAGLHLVDQAVELMVAALGHLVVRRDLIGPDPLFIGRRSVAAGITGFGGLDRLDAENLGDLSGIEPLAGEIHLDRKIVGNVVARRVHKHFGFECMGGRVMRRC